jgi:cytochrome c biogenesis protein CcdA/thiol-disulfide isomerase/thioredoxin
MTILILFAFLAGIVTILSPCILPVLPLILSSGLTGGKKRPLGVVAGFVASFTFFTLFLTSLVQTTGVSADLLRHAAVVVIAFFGITLLIPKWQALSEQLFSRVSNLIPQPKNPEGFVGGVLIGLSLGLIWTPCVGPILASVISLALTGAVDGGAFLITLSYSLGTALPLLAITYGGQHLSSKLPALRKKSAKIQQVFGVVMIATAFLLFFQLDRQLQTWILTTFPQYGVGLTKIEDIALVRQQLEQRKDAPRRTDYAPGETIEKFPAPELIPGGEWLNSQPLSIKSLRGKVVLVDFWTYTCINCIRTFPYIQRWHETYEKDGLVIIGVHTPEFEFEKNLNNVHKAAQDFGLTYPIMQDNDFSTWKAYDNRYWPAKYLIDAEGYVRDVHIGEGDYDKTEAKIQELLKEAGANISVPVENPEYTIMTRTPETYLGANRLQSLASPERVERNKLKTYSLPARLPDNYFALQGNWVLSPESANAQENSALEISFESGEVFLVMRPEKTGESKPVKVFLDGEPLGDQGGADVKDGVVRVSADQLYRLVKLSKPGRHILRLEFPEGGVEAFAFTFG